MNNEIREKLAEYAHNDAWSGWMKYLFSKGVHDANGTWVMPTWAVKRWTRQMHTRYVDLSESEKESDRHEADEMLKIIDIELGALRAENARLRAECETAEKLTPDELAALERYRKERDSDNEYTPWLSEGLTETQYFQRLYLANSNLLAVAEQVISAFVYPSAPMTPAQKEAWAEWTRLHGERDYGN